MVARKGPRKFASLKYEDLEIDQEYFKHFDTSFAQNEIEYNEIIKNQVFRNYALSPAFQAISEGKIVEVFRSTYTIGEHAQISWLDTEKTWVFANKHASIFIRDLNDLKAYKINHKSPYFTTGKIAEYWLDFFEKKIIDKEEFLKSVDRNTLCATFVDNNEFDSLVEYERPCLLFHTIVENESDQETCLPIDQNYAFFQKWGVDTAPLASIGEFTNYEELTQSLKEIHTKISNSTLKEDELGAVFYLVTKNGNPEVLSMTKIETKESLALNYLIRSLRSFWRANENVTKWNPKLEKEYNGCLQSYNFFLED